MFNRGFNFALATRVLLVCMAGFLVIIAFLFFVISSNPSLVAGRVNVERTLQKAQVISLFKYTHDKAAPPSFERATWDAFFLGSPAQRASLGQGLPDQAFAFEAYANAANKESWFMNEGIILMPSAPSSTTTTMPGG